MDPFTESMRKRGGGIKNISLVDLSESLNGFYQLHVEFKTADAMGANFINTVLEELAKVWKAEVEHHAKKSDHPGELEITMAILSNYTPESRVNIWLETAVDALGIVRSSPVGKSVC